MAAALERATERPSTEADGRVRDAAPPCESTPALRAGMITPHGRASRESLVTPGLVADAVKRAQAGDRQALGFLYARYADNVYGYVRSIVHDQHEAEDITQHVFAKLIHVIGKYEERDVPFFAWILRVARNVAVDHIRRHRAIPVEEVRAVNDVGGGAEDRERMNDLTGGAGGAAARPARGARAASLRRAVAGRDRAAHRPNRRLGPRAAPPRPPGAHRRAEQARRSARNRALESGGAHDEASVESASRDPPARRAPGRGVA